MELLYNLSAITFPSISTSMLWKFWSFIHARACNKLHDIVIGLPRLANNHFILLNFSTPPTLLPSSFTSPSWHPHHFPSSLTLFSLPLYFIEHIEDLVKKIYLLLAKFRIKSYFCCVWESAKIKNAQCKYDSDMYFANKIIFSLYFFLHSLTRLKHDYVSLNFYEKTVI